MMLSEDEILGRFDELITELLKVPESSGLYAYEYGHARVIIAAITSALNLIQMALGEQSVHATQLSKTIEADRGRRNTPAAVYRALIESARNDFAGGYYKNLRGIVAAQVFDDLLEMAEHLHENGYHLAAGSIAGAVLEDSLRKLCDAQGVERSDSRGINALNERLREADTYPQAQWRQIQAWGDLRNQVDHHKFEDPDEVDADAVERMIEGVRDLMVKYLT